MVKKIKTKIRKLYLFLLGRSLLLSKNINIESTWLGNNYGGFYIYPNKLNEKSVIYSFGIGEDISFDLEIISQYGCNVFGFDPTPKSIRWVDNNVVEEKFVFHPYGISVQSGFETFFLPKNSDNVSGSVHDLETVNMFDRIEVPMKKFMDIIKDLNHTTVDILKMDIEGAEYEVILDILNTQHVEIKQICVEFHHRLFKKGAKRTQETINLLEKYGFVLFAFSDSSEELSFINTKFI